MWLLYLFIPTKGAEIICQYWPVKGHTIVKPPTPAPTPVVRSQCSDTFINGDNDHVVSAEYYTGCTGLAANLKFNDNIVSIGTHAFYNCSSIVTVTLPKDIQTIYQNAFGCCSKLTTITFQNNYVEVIDAYAFEKCQALVSLKLPRYIGKSISCIIYDCQTLSVLTIQEASTCSYSWSDYKHDLYIHNSKTAVCRYSNQIVLAVIPITVLDIPSAVDRIGVQAYRYTKLKDTVTVPQQVVYLEQDCFCGCTSITKIVFKGCMQNINQFAFREAQAVSEYVIENLQTGTTYTPKYSTLNGIICSYDKAELLFYPNNLADETYILPYNAKSFSGQFFASLSSCKVKSFQMYASDGRSTFSTGDGKYLSLKNGLEVYSGNTIIKFPPNYRPTDGKYTLSTSYTRIGLGAFANCHIDTCLHCSKVTYIETWAFYQLTSKSITFDDVQKIAYIDEWAFHGADLTSFTFPGIEIGRYQTFSYASLQSIVISEGVKVLEAQFCGMCTALTSITFPNTLESIGQHAFEQSKVTAVDLPSINLRTIEAKAFFACSKLLSVYIPECVKFVYEYAFADCTSAQWVLIQNCNTCCDGKAFRSNDNKLQPECVATYVFTDSRCLLKIEPMDLFAKVIIGAMLIDECVIYC